MLRRVRQVWVGVILVSTLAMSVTPASASLSTVTGSLAFSGIATLTFYPCWTTCLTGSFTGVASGTVVGVSTGGVPYAVAWDLDDAMTASFNYGDDCLNLMPIPSSDGWAEGNFTLTGGHFLYGGNGDPVTLSGAFGWTRYGTTLVVGANAVTVTGAGGTVASGGLSENNSVATFVPITVPEPTCAGPSGRLDALVAGPDLQID
jgi:hypothetical protein